MKKRILKIRKFFDSLIFKIGAVIIGVEVIILFAIGVYYFNRFSNELDKRIETQIEIPGILMNKGLLSYESVENKKIMEQLVGEVLINALVIGLNQRVFYALTPDYRGKKLSEISGVEFTRQFNQNATESQIVKIFDGQNNYLISITPLHRENGELIGFLYIRAGTDYLESEKKIIIMLLVTGFILCVLLTTLAEVFLLRLIISTRIRDLVVVLRRVAAGDLTARVRESISQDEIGMLQKGFNSMTTQLQETVTTLHRQREQAQTLQKLGSLVASSLALDKVLDTIAHQVLELMKVPICSLMLLEPPDNLVWRINLGVDDEWAAIGRRKVGQGLSGWVALHRQPLVVYDMLEDERAAFLDMIRKYNLRSFLGVPMEVKGKLVGVLNIYTREPRHFTPEDVNLLVVFAGQAAIAVENAQLFEQVQNHAKHLEGEVVERTRDLTLANEQLQREVTERTKAEEQIKASLKEKEVLLKEIHHRVKNNLQVISSLLSLQSGYIKDKEFFEMFVESQNRVRSMALIHEKLYQSRDLARIDFAEYIRNLTGHLLDSYRGRTGAIDLKIHVEEVSLGIDKAIPCGLIINELVSNSLKHAFPMYAKTDLSPLSDRLHECDLLSSRGEIQVELAPDMQKDELETRSRFTLIVRDNGVGFPKDLDFRNTRSLGLQLVTTLTDQLKGTITLNNRNGTEFKITFTE